MTATIMSALALPLYYEFLIVIIAPYSLRLPAARQFLVNVKVTVPSLHLLSNFIPKVKSRHYVIFSPLMY